MNVKRGLLIVGVLLFGLAVTELVQPGFSPFPTNELFFSLIGAFLLVYAYLAFRGRNRDSSNYTATPDVECSEPTAVPGRDIGETLEGFPGTESVYTGVFSTVQEGLREATVSVLTRYDGLDEETARESIVDGTWTNDRDAAAFLSDGRASPDSLRGRLSRFLSRRRYQRLQIERTIDALARKADIEPPAENTDLSLPIDEELKTGTNDRISRDFETARIENRQLTNRWSGISVVALVTIGSGLLTQSPGILLAGVAGVGYVAYSRALPLGTVDLSVAREVSDSDPSPGDDVEITVTITNEGRFCPDLRVVDGVPEKLEVIEGSPRYGGVLRGGDSVTFSYTVQAKQGIHQFGPTVALARDLPGTVELELLLTADSTITAIPTLRPVQEKIPLRRQPTRFAGQMPTDSGGEGLEFHAIREYQPGDGMNRIDWNRRARTGELTTLEFRRERAAKVVILIDVQPSAHVGHAPESENVVERSVGATQRLFPALLSDGHQAGIGVLGPRDRFLSPDTGSEHRQRARKMLATDPTFHRPDSSTRGRAWIRNLRQKLSDETQLLVFTPLLELSTARVIRRLEAYGYPTTVISPDPTSRVTPDRRLMAVRRRLLITDLRQAGVPVLDWQPDEQLEEALKREVITR